ncbi:MAG: ATP-binding cassette domain-containing protein [Elusimicrobia bacterium]|nr:ATP-binding cassette domain-containing protein [Elusimicrobiota bacterium]
MDIQVNNLSKIFLVPQKAEGLRGAFSSLFHRKFREVKAVEDLSFSIEKGELVGFLGANGAGKTTTLKMLSGLLHSTSGEVKVLGFTPHQRRTSFLKQISLVMGQRSQLWWEIPAQETFKLNKEIYELGDKEYEEALSELVNLLELQGCLDIPVKRLSLGQRMKAELCAALLHRPNLLLLDEPTLGLDVVMQKRMRQFIKEYNQKFQATILLTSHNMDDVVALCERVIIIDRGKLLYDGSLRKVVEKYAPHKVMTVDFQSPVPLEKVASMGKIVSNGGSSLRGPLPELRDDGSLREARRATGTSGSPAPSTELRVPTGAPVHSTELRVPAGAPEGLNVLEEPSVLEGALSASRVVMEVPRKEVSRVASHLLSQFSVMDLTITETPLDEVVRSMFTNVLTRPLDTRSP